MEFGIEAPESKLEAEFSDSGRSGESSLRICTDNNGGGGDKKLKSENVDVKVENSGGDRFDDYQKDLFETKDVSDFQHDRLDSGIDRKESVVDLLSEFDDFVANDKSGAIGMAATSRAHSYGFEIGDMVWGKVKSHPWWPGHIFDEAFASSSVRRTRREGHVLVAFFGDSSYGWFDPAELIPFEPNFEEKSHQLNSRTFLKAVEEAVDEVSRRRGLGLACKCRNPYSFRPTVQGYVVVDVPDFEPGTAYSWDMIGKARDSFEPNETLSFVQQLAVAPQGGDQGSINFLSNKATIFTYRKAVFEEFDETYAEAFGMPHGLPSRDPSAVQPPRAPLSGPLVIAETLGVEKGPVKPMKVKDPSKKDRYLFKRRDEPDNSKNLQNSQGQVNSLAPLPLMGSQVELEAGDYVLQKRASSGAPKPQMPSKHEQTRFISKDSEAMSLDTSSKEDETAHVVTEVAKVYPDKGQDAQLEMEGMSRSDGGTRSTDFSETGDFPRVIDAGSESMQQENESGVITKSDGSVPKSDIEGLDRSDQVQASQSVLFDPSAAVAKRSDGTGSIGGVKKLKVKKRPAGEMSLDISGAGEMKKKKRVIGPDGSEQKPKFLAPGKIKLLSAGKLPRKSNQIGLDRKEDARVEKQKKTIGSYSSSSSHSVMPLFSKANAEIEVPQILSDLHSLALDPFHVIEKNSHVNVRQFILQFRSRVYQKSLAQSPPLDNDSVEVFSLAKTQVMTTASNNLPSEPARDLPSSKPTVKPISRLEDPTKSGRKRFPSDRQEEIAAKRLKKINVIKSLAAEKKASQKIPESQKGEEKNAAPPLALTAKSLKQDSVKKVESSTRKQDSFRKMERSAKTVNPTTLVLKFPPDTALPSLAELKARFARFGPIDQSGLRVFWKSFTCRVVFLHKADAQAAYKYALGNSSLFGTSGVRYQLRESEGPSNEISESGRSREDNNSNPSDIMTRVIQRPGSNLTPSPAVQLKSILKKSTGDEMAGGGGGGNGKGTPRVKFMLGGEESSRNNLNSAASSLPSSSSSVAMDFDSNNYFHQKVLPPSQLPPLLPLPPQFNTSTSPNLHYSEVPQPLPRNTQQNHMSTASNLTPTSTSTSTSDAIEVVDISQQMLSLLTRCNDVVTNLSGLLGYVPYHPL